MPGVRIGLRNQTAGHVPLPCGILAMISKRPYFQDAVLRVFTLAEVYRCHSSFSDVGTRPRSPATAWDACAAGASTACASFSHAICCACSASDHRTLLARVHRQRID